MRGVRSRRARDTPRRRRRCAPRFGARRTKNRSRGWARTERSSAADQGAEDAFAEARRAAGLDPLDDPEEGEDEEMDEEERAMVEEVRAPGRKADTKTKKKKDRIRARRTTTSPPRASRTDPGRRVRVSCRRWWRVTWESRGRRTRRRTRTRRGTRRRRNGRRARHRGSRVESARGVATGRDALMAAAAETRAGPRGEWTTTTGGAEVGATIPRIVEEDGAANRDQKPKKKKRDATGRRRGDGRGNAEEEEEGDVDGEDAQKTSQRPKVRVGGREETSTGERAWAVPKGRRLTTTLNNPKQPTRARLDVFSRHVLGACGTPTVRDPPNVSGSPILPSWRLFEHTPTRVGFRAASAAATLGRGSPDPAGRRRPRRR